MIAALYVAPNGSYIGLPGVDAWTEARDARLYAGPHPVVAHPPCQRWGKFWAGQPLHIKRTGEAGGRGGGKDSESFHGCSLGWLGMGWLAGPVTSAPGKPQGHNDHNTRRR